MKRSSLEVYPACEYHNGAVLHQVPCIYQCAPRQGLRSRKSHHDCLGSPNEALRDPVLRWKELLLVAAGGFLKGRSEVQNTSCYCCSVGHANLDLCDREMLLRCITLCLALKSRSSKSLRTPGSCPATVGSSRKGLHPGPYTPRRIMFLRPKVSLPKGSSGVSGVVCNGVQAVCARHFLQDDFLHAPTTRSKDFRVSGIS